MHRHGFVAVVRAPPRRRALPVLAGQHFDLVAAPLHLARHLKRQDFGAAAETRQEKMRDVEDSHRRAPRRIIPGSMRKGFDELAQAGVFGWLEVEELEP